MAVKPPARVGMKQIAEITGHSIMTVSRALNNHPEIAHDTRERILEVAQRLKYRPNLLVRGMQTGKTRMIGVLLPVHLAFYSKVFSGIHDQLVAANHVPIVLWSAADARDKQGASELDQIHQLLDRRVDGVILKPVIDAINDDYLKEIWERNIPLVVVDRELPHSRADFVGTDDMTGGRLAAEHLLDLGHRHFGQLACSDAVGTYRDRRVGFEQMIASRRGASCTTLVINDGMDEWAMAARLLASTPRPTAIFLAHDALGAPIYDAAAAAGLRIPEDLSVVGYADLDCAEFLRPKLTTIRQDACRIGRATAKLLLEIASNPVASRSKEKRRLCPELVIRSSTAPLNRTAAKG